MLANWLERSRRAGGLVSAVLLAGLLFGAESALAQQGAVGGQVTDAETLQPVAGAQVFVPGTVLGALTNDEGRYRLEGVPVGQATVRVQLIGYKRAEQTVAVQAGQIATADFQLEQTALRLQDIIVTGVVGETPRVKLPFTVERLDAADIPVPTSNASTLIAGKAAGVQVVQGSGQPGSAASIMLRGATSIDATGRSQAPLIVVDGVIQSESATLADINALDIDHIEIVKGAAAASLYGARAQAGVIEISTKRGSNLEVNTVDFLARGEFGMSQLGNKLPIQSNHPYLMNESQTAFIDSDGNEVQFNDLSAPGFGDEILTCDVPNSTGPGACGEVTVPGVGTVPRGTTETAFQDKPFPRVFDQIDRFFDPGETSSVYGAATGRFSSSSFRVSFERFREQGVISCSDCEDAVVDLNNQRVTQGLQPFDVEERIPRDEGYERRNARLNIDTEIGDLSVGASGFYSNSTQDDAAVGSGAFFSLTFMAAGLDLATLDEDGFPKIDIDPLSAEENPLYQLAIINSEDDQSRTMGSIDASYRPIDWLTLEVAASYDRTDFSDVVFFPKNQKTGGGGEVITTGGSLERGNFTEEALGGTVTAGVNRALMDGDLTTRLKVRYVLERQEFDSNGLVGNRFAVADVPNFDNIVGTQQGENELREIRGEGYFFIGGLDYKGRYILDGLARRDGSSLFGPEERWHWYYRGSGAYRISQEPWWNIDFIDELKFRYSYGTAGGRPNFFAQYETFGIQGGQVFPINLGNRALKPEFTIEQEAGTNLVLFDDVGIDVTYAWATTDDQLLVVPQPAYVGFIGQWRNAGKIRSRTWEASLRWAALDTRDVGLNFRVNWDRTRQKIIRLDIPPFKAGTSDAFWVAEGEPLGAIWGTRFATNCGELESYGIDASACAANFQLDDNGLLVPVGEGNQPTEGVSEGLWGTRVDVGGQAFRWGIPVAAQERDPICLRAGEKPVEECPLTTFLPMGNTTPDFNGSFAANLRYKGFSLHSLLDAAIGMEIYNGTIQWAYRENRGADYDQAGKPVELKKPIAYYERLYNVNDESSWFVEDGSYVKVRELSVGYTLPDDLLQSWFNGIVDRMTLNVIGRNLFTFTDYRGYDPEVGQDANLGVSVGSSVINRQDRFGYPNFRTFTASLELVF